MTIIEFNSLLGNNERLGENLTVLKTASAVENWRSIINEVIDLVFRPTEIGSSVQMERS